MVFLTRADFGKKRIAVEKWRFVLPKVDWVAVAG